MLRRAETCFEAGREAALPALRRAAVVASDETGVRIEGANSFHWVFHCQKAVVHHAASTRAASVLREIMDGHRPAVWLSDRYAAQQGHADRQQACLAHLARDVAYALEAGDDPLTLRLKLWLDAAFVLARSVTTLALSTVASRRRKLERVLDDILARYLRHRACHYRRLTAINQTRHPSGWLPVASPARRRYPVKHCLRHRKSWLT